MKQKIQIFLIVSMLAAGIRLGWILYERHQDAAQSAKKEAPPLNPDYYVTPKKLYLYDLKSAKQLTKQPAWVKVGYAYSYFPYDAAAHRANLAKEAGKLLPIQKLEIKDIATGISPHDPGERHALAIFVLDGKTFPAPNGTERRGESTYYADEMLIYQDPHELYRHWPADAWQAIDQHQVKPGMSEMQTVFAIGIGLMHPGSDSSDKTLDYPNGGKPLSVSYREGKVVQVAPGTE
jgi:hypothetical protein